MTGFHNAFERALEGDPSALWPHVVPDDRTLGAIAVYRNTTTKARVDALRANYPTVLQIVGEDWFHAAAVAFAREHPGEDPVMVGFGSAFPGWLARFEPARDLPYLAPCARLDRAWTEVHVAPEAAALEAARAASRGAALAGMTAGLHPAARIFWFEWTVPSLWLAHRHPAGSAALDWSASPEGLLIHREDGRVLASRLSRGEWTFLDACRQGRSLGAAAMAASAFNPDFSSLFARLLSLGVLVETSPETPS